jgi:hypothetical protein
MPVKELPDTRMLCAVERNTEARERMVEIKGESHIPQIPTILGRTSPSATETDEGDGARH